MVRRKAFRETFKALTFATPRHCHTVSHSPSHFLTLLLGAILKRFEKPKVRRLEENNLIPGVANIFSDCGEVATIWSVKPG